MCPISNEDLEAIYDAKQLGLDIPESLVNTAWFLPFVTSRF